jgi:hypothetical protein
MNDCIGWPGLKVIFRQEIKKEAGCTAKPACIRKIALNSDFSIMLIRASPNNIPGLIKWPGCQISTSEYYY